MFEIALLGIGAFVADVGYRTGLIIGIASSVSTLLGLQQLYKGIKTEALKEKEIKALAIKQLVTEVPTES